MYELINEPIEVFVDFTGEGPVPVAFIWRQRNYQIDKINFTHTSKQGNAKLFHFSVSTQTGTYKITLDARNMSWILDEIYADTNFSQTSNVNDAAQKSQLKHENKNSHKKTNTSYRLR